MFYRQRNIDTQYMYIYICNIKCKIRVGTTVYFLICNTTYMTRCNILCNVKYVIHLINADHKRR